MKKIIGFSLLATAVVFCLTFWLAEAQTTGSTASTVVSTTQTTAGQIDLSINASDMKITPTTYASGDKITLSAKVANLGNTKATNIKVDFYFGSAKVYTKTLTSLSAKSKTTVSYQYTVPTDFVGSTIFRAVADLDNTILESNEDNNTAEIKANVEEAKIDLTIDSIKTSVAKPKVGQKISIQVKVKNNGNTKATNAKLEVYLGKDESPTFTSTISSISKNSTYSKSFSWTIPNDIPEKDFPIKAIIDPKNEIKETDEANNEKVYLLNLGVPESVNESSTTSKTLKPSPTSTTRSKTTTTTTKQIDLSILASDMKITPVAYKGGDKITLSAKVANLGNTKATNIKVDFYFGSAKVYTKTLTSLSAKSKTNIIYQYTIPVNLSGSVIFKVVVDENNTIVESNENNNSAEITTNVNQAIIDLVIDSVKTSVNKPKVGQKVSIQVKVRNNGNVKAANVKINVYLGDNNNISAPNFTDIISSINKNAVASKSFSWTIPNNISATNYPIRAVVDPDNSITESNELNNSKTYLLNLTAPDLKIESQFSSERNFVGNTFAGGSHQLSLFVSNDNVMPVDNPKLGLFYYFPSDPDNLIKIGESTVGQLKKNWKVPILLNGRLPNTLQIGSTIGLVAKIDYDGVISETNEDNNTITYLLTVATRPSQLSCPCLFINVKDEDWNPINGATVTLNTNESKTTVGGRVIFENRPNTATYVATIAAPNYRTLTETVNFDQSKEEKTFFTYQLDKKALLTGTVKNPSGSSLQGTIVRVDGLGLESITDSQGKYGFLLNGGTYTLRFVREGYNRLVESNYNVPPLSTKVLDKTMTPGTSAYVSFRVTDDEGNGLGNVNVFINNNLVGTTWEDGHFDFTPQAAENKKFTLKKSSYIDTEFTENIVAGKEYHYDLTMYKPSTANHVERGATIVSWHQHEGTPANAYFIPEYNVDVWWGIGNIKMGLDYTKSGDQTKLTKLTVNVHGRQWECNKVEGDAEVETSAIDIPITIAAGSCSNKQTQMDVYKVAIESNGTEVWSDSSFWTSASDPNNTKTKVFTLNNLPVNWNNNLKVKVWLRVQKKAAIGTEGDGSGVLSGYYMDKKLITWYPQKPPTTKISTSWGQIGGYFLGILDNPLNAVTGFTDVFTAEQYDQYEMVEVLPQDFPGAPPSY